MAKGVAGMVTVGINKSRCHNLTFRIRYFFCSGIREVPDKGNRIVAYADIGFDAGGPGSIIHDSIPDDTVVLCLFIFTGRKY